MAYVRKAIERYKQDGLEATIAHYNSPDSLEGEFYLFLTDENDIYLAQPVFPRLVGTDIKEVVAPNGYEVGKEVAKATEEGRWLEYVWPHSVTGKEQNKISWVIRHDGMVLAPAIT
jgi:signal transduction histidine kinase